MVYEQLPSLWHFFGGSRWFENIWDPVLVELLFEGVRSLSGHSRKPPKIPKQQLDGGGNLHQLLVNWWFEILVVPLRNNPFHTGIPRIQKTNLPLADYINYSCLMGNSDFLSEKDGSPQIHRNHGAGIFTC